MSAKCFFSDNDAEIVPMNGVDGYAYRTKLVDEYFLSGQAHAAYKDKLTEKQKFLCLQETIKLNNENLVPLWIVDDKDFKTPPWEKIVLRKIGDFKEREVSHKEKQKNILEFLAKKASQLLNPFDFINLTDRERISIGIISEREYTHWILSLADQGIIELSDEGKAFRKATAIGRDPLELITKHLQTQKAVRITTKGWSSVYSDKSLLSSRNAFIAMAFTDDTGHQLPTEHRDCIRLVLETLDWKPIIVDEVPHNDGVMDKIIASINHSRFVIADITYHKNGVYFEAGYAKGLGLPVILTVKKDHLDRSHFDVKHLNLVVWEDFNDLKKKLAYRIDATIPK